MKSKHRIMIMTILLVPLLVLSSANNVQAGTVIGETQYVDAVIFFNADIEVNLGDAVITHQYSSLNGMAARIPEAMFNVLKNSWFVESITLDKQIFNSFQDTLDWGVDDVNAERVWGGVENAVDIVPGNVDGTGVKVAIIDTGIDYTHPDLDGVYLGGYDFVNNDADPKDDNGHGTHCAGIVAAEDNGVGVIGTAPNAGIYALKVLDAQGSGYTSDIIAGIDWAVSNGADVISMSLGGGGYDASFDSAINNAYNAGVVVVAASGNDGTGTISYPAKYANAIAVGAIDSAHNLASFSNWGPEQEVVAPGVNIYSTMPTYAVTLTNWYYGYSQNYDQMSGTSMATPMVAGVVALILDANPSLTPAEVRNIFETTSRDLGATGWDQTFGWGAVEAEAAVAAAGGGTPGDNPPTCTITDPANGATVSGTHRILVSASDDNSVSKVEVNIDGGTWIDITSNFDGTSYFYDWDTTTYTDGSHTVNARATDSAAQTSTDSAGVTVNNGGGATDTMHVASIDMWYETVRFWFWTIGYDVYTRVTVHDGFGNTLSGVTVSLEMTLPGGSLATGSADTGADGTVTFVYEASTSQTGTYTSTVTNLVKTGYTYVPSDNIVTSTSISVP